MNILTDMVNNVPLCKLIVTYAKVAITKSGVGLVSDNLDLYELDEVANKSRSIIKKSVSNSFFRIYGSCNCKSHHNHFSEKFTD